MPILGLFNTRQEDKYGNQVRDLASGKQTSQAVQGIAQDAGRARKQAFAQAFQSRGNPALARRQAMDAGVQIQANAGQQTANQRAADQTNYQQEANRLEAQKTAGINNAVGFGMQAASTLIGGPAAGLVGSNIAPIASNAAPRPPAPVPPTTVRPATQADPVQNAMASLDRATGPMGEAESFGTMSGPELRMPMQPGSDATMMTPRFQAGGISQAGQAAVDRATSGDYQDPSTRLNSPEWILKQRQLQQQGGLLSDERMKTDAQNGDPAAQAFLDALSNHVAQLRQSDNAGLQRGIEGVATAAPAAQLAVDRTLDLARSNPIGLGQDVAPGAGLMGGKPKPPIGDQLNDPAANNTFDQVDPGTNLGVMAQDLQAADPSLVSQGPDGAQRINVNRALSASLAAQANLNNRLRALEQDPLSPEALGPPGGRISDLYSRTGNSRNPAVDRPQRAHRSGNRPSGGRRESNQAWDARTRPFLDAFLARSRAETGIRQVTHERQFSDPNKFTPVGQRYSYAGGR